MPVTGWIVDGIGIEKESLLPKLGHEPYSDSILIWAQIKTRLFLVIQPISHHSEYSSTSHGSPKKSRGSRFNKKWPICVPLTHLVFLTVCKCFLWLDREKTWQKNSFGYCVCVGLILFYFWIYISNIPVSTIWTFDRTTLWQCIENWVKCPRS